MTTHIIKRASRSVVRQVYDFLDFGATSTHETHFPQIKTFKFPQILDQLNFDVVLHASKASNRPTHRGMKAFLYQAIAVQIHDARIWGRRHGA